MHQSKADLTVVMDTPDAVVQHQAGFGTAADDSELAAERFRVSAGTDLTPLLEGLPDDACQCPHWGYVIAGEVTVRYSDDTEEVAEAGDVVYWPPGHTAWVDEDAEFVLFSPHEDHMAVFEHMATKMGE
ncbi:cupin domain-containing protein [Natronorubrum aibiense]|uniref:Cupin domain-containing protein n=1 Tax=Natronorubrum aibiense TaxID=348826 RepID=A0A5P9P5Q7_9EURY|nr:cupin domain-containing protein [Natronorubrum aibiense]QFU83462.1 cupin domain-containing protein [Natronorubrum aibiense]